MCDKMPPQQPPSFWKAMGMCCTDGFVCWAPANFEPVAMLYPHMREAVLTEHPVDAWAALSLQGSPKFPDIVPMQKHHLVCQTTKKMILDKSKDLKIKCWLGIVSMQRQQEISRHLICGSTSPAFTWLLVPSGLTSPQGRFCYVCMSCPLEKHMLFWASQSREELHG